MIPLQEHASVTRSAAPPQRRVSPWAVPVLLLLLALTLRVFHLMHESVSGDEAFSISLTQLPLGDEVHKLVLDMVHPPLHYLALRGWLKLFGFGLLQARVLSVIFGALAVIFLYWLAKYLFDRRVAAVAALLMAVSQLAIMFSQEARPYALMHTLALLSAYLFLRALREQRAGLWWGFVGATVLLIYTNYFGVLLLAGLLLVAMIYPKRYRLRPGWALGGAVGTVALYMPWLASGVVREAVSPGRISGGTVEYSAVHWWTFFSILNSFNNGKPAGLRADSPWWTYAVGTLLFTLPLATLLREVFAAKPGAAAAEREDRGSIVIAGILWLLPILLTLACGRGLHIPYNVRYVSFCAAFYYMLVGRAIFELPLHGLRWGLLALILLYSANALRANYFLRWKENWTEAYAYVEANRQQGDCGVFPPDFKLLQPWQVTQAGRVSFRMISQEALASGAPGCDRIWEVAGAPRDDWRQWNDYKKQHDPIPDSFVKVDERRFYGVRVNLYSQGDK
jgi:uncharacterized membrane protein